MAQQNRVTPSLQGFDFRLLTWTLDLNFGIGLWIWTLELDFGIGLWNWTLEMDLDSDLDCDNKNIYATEQT